MPIHMGVKDNLRTYSQLYLIGKDISSYILLLLKLWECAIYYHR